ncbi:MAG: FmdB family transcriptional regulator [Candidatus Marinimicrobia bacterium]|nr:FmdB family transcriptional regulator [Candidatus Neomarinimicrobiota bacterium]
MPTYEYRCTKCEHRFEMLQTMSEAPRKRCPECGCKVERLIGAGAGLIFKGSGFYITDYVKKNGDKEKPKEAAESNGESQPSSDKKSEKKAESKKSDSSKSKPKAKKNK